MSLLDYTAQITKAFFAHNRVPIEEVPHLIERVHASLTELSHRQAAASAIQAYAQSQGVTGANLRGEGSTSAGNIISALMDDHTEHDESESSALLADDPVERLRGGWLEDMISEKLANAEPWSDELDDDPESPPSNLAERRDRLGFNDAIWGDMH